MTGHDLQRSAYHNLIETSPSRSLQALMDIHRVERRIVRGDHAVAVVDGPDPTPACAPEPARASGELTLIHLKRRTIAHDAGWRP